MSEDEPKDEPKEEVSSWELPYIEKPQNDAEHNKTNMFNRRSDWKYEPPEEEEEILPPTAEEIEAIRASAQADGFAEGHREGIEQGQQEGVKTGFDEGFAKGLEDGTQQGLTAAQEEVSDHIKSLLQLVEHLQKPVESVDKRLEKELVELSVSLARAVIRCEVKTNENLIFQALSEGLKILPIQESHYQIHLHPDDIGLVSNHFSEAEIEKQRWNFVESPELKRGGCEIITDTNAVDITIERRVKDVLDRFLLEQGMSNIHDDVSEAD